MPITQNRMLRLIQAAENIHMTSQGLIDTILLKAARINQGTLTYEQAFKELSIECKAFAANSDAIAVIVEERWRFNLTYSRNAYDKKRQESKRREIGMKPQKHTRFPERNLLTGPNPILSTAAHAARVAADIEQTDNIPDYYELENVELDENGLPVQTPEELAEYRQAKAREMERQRIQAEMDAKAAAIDEEVNKTATPAAITKI